MHVVVDVRSTEQTDEWAGTALDAGADGVFLISHARDEAALVDALLALRAARPEASLGAMLIGRTPAEALAVLAAAGAAAAADALWTDSAGSDPGDAEVRGAAFAERREAAGWRGLHFGGVAFKHQPDVDPADLAALTAAAARHVDVVTTSGRGTGQAVDAAKLATMRAALGAHPLALASGVTPENAHQVRDHVQHVLVSTGTAAPDGSPDPVRVRSLRAALAG